MDKTEKSSNPNIRMTLHTQVTATINGENFSILVPECSPNLFPLMAYFERLEVMHRKDAPPIDWREHLLAALKDHDLQFDGG